MKYAEYLGITGFASISFTVVPDSKQKNQARLQGNTVELVPSVDNRISNRFMNRVNYLFVGKDKLRSEEK